MELSLISFPMTIAVPGFRCRSSSTLLDSSTDLLWSRILSANHFFSPTLVMLPYVPSILTPSSSFSKAVCFSFRTNRLTHSVCRGSILSFVAPKSEVNPRNQGNHSVPPPLNLRSSSRSFRSPNSNTHNTARMFNQHDLTMIY